MSNNISNRGKDRCILHPRAVTDGTLALSASCLILKRGGLAYVVF